jgi:hypothetical protein
MNGHFSGQRRVVAAICGVVPVALLAVLAGAPAAAWSRLPARVADHWSLAGTANGSAPRLVPFLLLGGTALIGVAICWSGVVVQRNTAGRGNTAGRPVPGAMSRPEPGSGAGWPARRFSPPPGLMLVTVGLFMIAISAASATLVTVANVGVADWRDASVGAGGLVGLAGGPVALTAGASYLLRRRGGLGATDDGSVRPSLGLRETERAVWTGQARAAWPAPTGIALLAVAVFLGLAGQWGATAALSVAGVAMFGLTSVRVTVAARGVTVAYGPLGLRLTRIPLRRILRAEAIDRTALGLGYRGSLTVFGSAAVALRRGPALSLTLRGRKAFIVTVDDAATGAALLNDLIAANPAPAGAPD